MPRIHCRAISQPQADGRLRLPAMLVLLVILLGCDPTRDLGAVRPECRPLPSAIALARAPIDNDGPADGPNDPTPPPPPPLPTFGNILDGFCGLDINSDGLKEINSLTPLFRNQEPYTPMPNGVALVLVDPRLVTEDSLLGVSRFEMLFRLAQLRQDLFDEGYFAYFVRASVYAGQRHQDGRTLLAMRRFLQRVRAHYPLRSVLLIGSFPDAAIVRTVLGRATGNVERPKAFPSGPSPLTGYTGDFLFTDSELITTRGEIVLGDLDGNWEALYRETLEAVDLHVVPHVSEYPRSNQFIPMLTYERISRPFEDVFHIVDHNVRFIRPEGSVLTLNVGDLAEPSPEVSAADRQLPNRIARPEIAIGRINPRGVAVMPYTGRNDLDGRQPLDQHGVPQRLRFKSTAFVRWRRDATLERRLVADYLTRAHDFRTRPQQQQAIVSSIRGPDTQLISPAAFNDILRPAVSGPVTSTTGDNVSLIGIASWLKGPALLRGITTHCDEISCQFAASAPARFIEIASGAPSPGTRIWRWHDQVEGGLHTLTPSFADMTTDGNSYFYRTLWENRILASAGQNFIIHNGCEVMRPLNSATEPYNSDTYNRAASEDGRVSNGESMLFFANGLGLMARNKVFNDTPNGFSQAIRASGRFGYGWMGYFAADAADQSLDERTADSTTPERRTRTFQRKRSYFWNTIGDPTLKLRY